MANRSRQRNRYVSYDEEDGDDWYYYDEEDEEEDYYDASPSTRAYLMRRASQASDGQGSGAGWFENAVNAGKNKTNNTNTNNNNNSSSNSNGNNGNNNGGKNLKGAGGPGPETVVGFSTSSSSSSSSSSSAAFEAEVAERVRELTGGTSVDPDAVSRAVARSGVGNIDNAVAILIEELCLFGEQAQQQQQQGQQQGKQQGKQQQGQPMQDKQAPQQRDQGGERSSKKGASAVVIPPPRRGAGVLDLSQCGPASPVSSPGGKKGAGGGKECGQGRDSSNGKDSGPGKESGGKVVMPKQHASRNKRAEAELDAFLARGDAKEHLNLVIIGHVDAGKSTLMGNVLHKLGCVSDRAMHRLAAEARDSGKESFHFAFVLDENEEERSRGVTMDVGVSHFETEGRAFTLLDAPGHRDFVPNMISGAAQADAAVLVVDSRVGEFESGFLAGGQTKEHILLARSLGVSQVVVAVNKLEVAAWAEDRFDYIRGSLESFLRVSGYPRAVYVPVSGLSGENLLRRSDPALEAWYSGPTLVEAIDAFAPAERDDSLPLRFTVVDVFRSTGQGSISVSGKVEAGRVVLGDRVAVMPMRCVAQVRSIECRGEAAKFAVAGQNVLIGMSGIDRNMVRVGSVLCDPLKLVRVVRSFTARIVTAPDLRVPLIGGSKVLLFSQSGQEPAVVTKITATVDKATGEPSKRPPRTIGTSTTADVVITFSENPMCLEHYKDYKPLGRFSLRQKTATVASGIVTSILDGK